MMMKENIENIQQWLATVKKQADSDIKELKNIVDNDQSLEELHSKTNDIQNQTNKYNSSLSWA